MERYKSTNGLDMLRCQPLNWRIQRTYRDGTGPEFFSISVGSLSEMFVCVYIPEEKTLSFSNMSYSSDCSVKFRVENFQDASKMVLSFAEGMCRDIKETIFWNDKCNLCLEETQEEQLG